MILDYTPGPTDPCCLSHYYNATTGEVGLEVKPHVDDGARVGSEAFNVEIGENTRSITALRKIIELRLVVTYPAECIPKYSWFQGVADPLVIQSTQYAPVASHPFSIDPDCILLNLGYTFAMNIVSPLTDPLASESCCMSVNWNVNACLCTSLDLDPTTI